MSELYQRETRTAPGFVPNHAYETGVFLKFVVDHYDNLPEVTAFVSGDFTKDAGGDANARAALENVADAVSVSKLGKKNAGKVSGKGSRKAFAKDPKDKDDKDAATSSDVPPAIASYQPLVVDPETFLQSRSPGELVQMWKEQRWGWEDIMGDSAGAAAQRTCPVLAPRQSFGADPRLSTTVRKTVSRFFETRQLEDKCEHRAWALRSSSPPAATPPGPKQGERPRGSRRLRDGGSRRAR